MMLMLSIYELLLAVSALVRRTNCEALHYDFLLQLSMTPSVIGTSVLRNICGDVLFILAQIGSWSCFKEEGCLFIGSKVAASAARGKT
jgi:hypothetical protein